MSNSAMIYDYVRTPIGRAGGVLSTKRPDDLAAEVITAIVERNGVDPQSLNDIVLGCANQAGEDSRNVARNALLLAGLPYTVSGVTVNRLCASGLEAAMLAARAIGAGEGELFIAGGVESMTRAPWVLGKPDRPFARGTTQLEDSALGWRMTNPAMPKEYLDSLGQTAENVATHYGISREDQDTWALRSHERAVRAQRNGWIAGELLTTMVPRPKGEPVAVSADEGPRPDTSLEVLGRLRPAFGGDGSVTAGNSSPLNDGAAALLIGSSDAGARLGLRPLARIVAAASGGVHPGMMGMGPVPATRKALERAKMAVEEIELVEINEAFASQVLACVRELGLDEERVNVNGGAIAIGHPLGCSGARLLGTLVRQLREQGARHGLVTLCIGVGQGLSCVVESV
jgi:3-oxoadipyl-CoA thiolase